MEIRERIESCLSALDARRRRMAEFETKVRALMDSLRTQGSSPSTIGEILEVLTSALENYGEIDSSCRDMIAALGEIGRNQEQIENGRRKIIDGVEKILAHLTQMETLAKQSMMDTQAQAPAPAEGEGRPKKILLIRLRPQRSGDDARESKDQASPPSPVKAGREGIVVKPGPAAREADPVADFLSLEDETDLTVH